jgi:hypothetical protein
MIHTLWLKIIVDVVYKEKLENWEKTNILVT